jgi:DNA polymerase-3 subunit alpha
MVIRPDGRVPQPGGGCCGRTAEVRALVETDAEVATIFTTARGLEGLIRNAGVHACAVIIPASR